jgi:hypothetical protein
MAFKRQKFIPKEEIGWAKMFKQVFALARPKVDAAVNRRVLRSDARLDSTHVPKEQ